MFHGQKIELERSSRDGEYPNDDMMQWEGMWGDAMYKYVREMMIDDENCDSKGQKR